MAYACLTGGGVKGAALAGAVEEAQSLGVQFKGYGGSSAGALVSALFAVGYSGADIHGLLSERILPKHFLDDHASQTTKYEVARRLYKEMKDFFAADIGFWRTYNFWRKNKADIAAVFPLREYGLYRGDAFASIFDDLLKKAPALKDAKGPITFRTLADRRCPDLKIIAANLSTRKAVCFDRESHPDLSLVTAVRASVGYPFVFAPVTIENYRYCDGGLASNLPVFGFQKDHARTGFPILAFDIEEPPPPVDNAYDVGKLAAEVINCALEASDQLLMTHLPGVQVIPITFDRYVRTFELSADGQLMGEMYKWGRHSVGSFLQDFKPLEAARRAASAKQQAISIFQRPSLIAPTLWAAKKAVEEHTAAKDVRVGLALPSPVDDGATWLTCYYQGSAVADPESALEFEAKTEAVARCLSEKAPVIIDLTTDRVSGLEAEWRSLALFPVLGTEGTEEGQFVRALLWMITQTAPVDAGWIDEGGAGGLVSPQLAHYTGGTFDEIGTIWAETLYYLRGYGR